MHHLKRWGRGPAGRRPRKTARAGRVALGAPARGGAAGRGDTKAVGGGDTRSGRRVPAPCPARPGPARRPPPNSPPRRVRGLLPRPAPDPGPRGPLAPRCPGRHAGGGRLMHAGPRSQPGGARPVPGPRLRDPPGAPSLSRARGPGWASPSRSATHLAGRSTVPGPYGEASTPPAAHRRRCRRACCRSLPGGAEPERRRACAVRRDCSAQARV
jgi:hypothetical protein